MATFLICHGAWSAGWAWKKVRPLLRAAGHEVSRRPHRRRRARASGEPRRRPRDARQGRAGGHRVRGPAARSSLVGHSYGGMVATGVADRVPERVKQLDLPRRLRAGERAEPARPARAGAATGRQRECEDGSSRPTDAAGHASGRLAWLTPRRRPQPVKTFTQPVQLRNPRAEVSAQLHPLHAGRRRTSVPAILQALQIRSRAGATSKSTASHSPNVTAPEALVRLLTQIAGGALSGPTRPELGRSSDARPSSTSSPRPLPAILSKSGSHPPPSRPRPTPACSPLLPPPPIPPCPLTPLPPPPSPPLFVRPSLVYRYSRYSPLFRSLQTRLLNPRPSPPPP